jgi:hypothetical protein
MKEIRNLGNENRPVSITPSGFFGDSSDNIVEIQNFMSPEELEIVSNFARSIEQWDETITKYNEDGTIIYDSLYWKDRVLTSKGLSEQSPEVYSIIENLMNILQPIIQDFFNLEETKPTPPAIVRWFPGQKQLPHADKELHEGDNAGKPNDFPHYDLASLFYLNDDYEGGELYFPNQGIKFKPKAGFAYFFPGDMNYIHGVTEVVSGIRYTCPFFWTILKHKDNSNE